MREVEFVNDLRCNYLTIPYEGREDDFALRMLTENAANGFLPLELRRMDGQAYLYYNISGMQNMEVIYAERTIDQEAFRTFMWQLHEAIEESRELFLPGEGICLEPSALFWNLGNRRWEFIYIPNKENRGITEIQSEREQLAEFLVMRIDYGDKNLTDTAYRFYEEICAGRMHPDIFLEKGRIEDEEEQEKEGLWEVEEKWKEAGDDAEEEIEKRETESDTEKTKESKRLQRTLIVLWCVAVVTTVLLGKTMQNIILPGGAVVGLLTALLLCVQIKQKHFRHDSDLEGGDISYMEEMEVCIPYDEESGESQDMPEEERTVYMDIDQRQERKLYGIGKFRQCKIFLEKLPCIIGKDKTMANYIISDTSVSRVHARFFSEAENLWMQDLNSTNGTYHNGLRLRPNEKVMLESEDEIGFGRVQFVFR